MADLFVNSFEEGDFSAWDNDVSGTFAISQVQVIDGIYSARSNRAVSGTGFVRKAVFGVNNTGTAYARVYVYLVSYPSANSQYIRWSNTSNTAVGRINLNTDGTLHLLAQNGSEIGTGTAPLALDTWHYVELMISAPSNPGTLEGKLNGTVFASGNNSAQGSFARFLIGAITPSSTGDMYFDAVAISDSAYPGALPSGVTPRKRRILVV